MAGVYTPSLKAKIESDDYARLLRYSYDQREAIQVKRIDTTKHWERDTLEVNFGEIVDRRFKSKYTISVKVPPDVSNEQILRLEAEAWGGRKRTFTLLDEDRVVYQPNNPTYYNFFNNSAPPTNSHRARGFDRATAFPGVRPQTNYSFKLNNGKVHFSKPRPYGFDVPTSVDVLITNLSLDHFPEHPIERSNEIRADNLGKKLVGPSGLYNPNAVYVGDRDNFVMANIKGIGDTRLVIPSTEVSLVIDRNTKENLVIHPISVQTKGKINHKLILQVINALNGR